MNREAAVLDVPVYSIFQGKLGAVDRFLSATGRLKIIQSKEDLKEINLIKRRRPTNLLINENRELVNYLVDKIFETGEMTSDNN